VSTAAARAKNRPLAECKVTPCHANLLDLLAQLLVFLRTGFIEYPNEKGTSCDQNWHSVFRSIWKQSSQSDLESSAFSSIWNLVFQMHVCV
jgi:hypothetical protein